MIPEELRSHSRVVCIGKGREGKGREGIRRDPIHSYLGAVRVAADPLRTTATRPWMALRAVVGGGRG